ncbi:torso-like protein [Ostrinia furnacalis]|uniref:torso-like protein n=1 Tax=Ostrinia furnacalis TaxID=93504 RepID=UPI00103DAA12|nr:torso-like protein [Ostrinia furnacalis]
MLLLVLLLICCSVCKCEVGDLGYDLNIGNTIDVFANYGDLSQVTQVVSADYEDDGQEPIVPFSEKNLRVFANSSSRSVVGGSTTNMEIQICDTFEDLLNTYFSNFKIEGTDRPWKAFMGDWVDDEILRTMGIMYDGKLENCCYVLVKWTKPHTSAQLDDLTGVAVKDHVGRAVDNLNVSDTAEVRRFMKSYGTHYIDSYVTGNFIYQVFKYKRSGFNLLRAYMRVKVRNAKASNNSDNLRFYFSSYFLKQVGDIKVASGNKTVEAWAKKNLRESQYLYSRPSLLKLHYSPYLAYKLNELLRADNGALLGLDLKTLRPLFKDRNKAEKYAEIVENDLKLWEVNA